jgi:hypothetical protein
MKLVINCETQEETIVELTQEELEQAAIDNTNSQAQAAAEAAKAEQKAALLTRLGITEEEARLLLGGN